MTWDGIRGTLQWMLLLLLIGVIAAAGFALHYWSRKDQLIHELAADKLAEIFPDCQVQFRQVEFPDPAHVVIDDLQLTAKHSGMLLARIPRIKITLSGDLLETRQVVIERILLESPQFFILRNSDGEWNWHRLTPVSSRQHYTPSIQIRNGQLQLGVQSTLNGPLHRAACQNIEMTFVPAAHQRFEIQGSTVIDSLGDVGLSGLMDARSGKWELTGRAAKIRVDEPLLERTGHWVPEVGDRLAQLREHPKYLARRGLQSEPPVRMVSAPGGLLAFEENPKETEQPVLDAAVDSFLRADIELDFFIGQTAREAPLDYRVKTRIEHGQVSDLFLPIPLYDIRARIELTPDRLEIEEFRAANNESTLFVSGHARRVMQDWSRQFVVRASNLQIDERVQSILPAEFLKVFQLLNPSGTFDLDFNIAQEPGENWTGQIRRFAARNCRVVHDYFRYPIENVSGEITHAAEQFQIEMHGTMSSRPVTLTGTWGDGRHGNDADLTIKVDNLPLNERFLNAFSRPEQAGTQAALRSLRMTGVTDLQARFVRSLQTDEQFKMQLQAKVRQATVNFIGFPYELEHFEGEVRYDALRDNVWRFRNLQAVHKRAEFTGQGDFDLTQDPGELRLEIGAVRVPIDKELEQATLTSGPHLEPVWRDYALTGTVDVEKISLDWKPGESPAIRMEAIRWRDGSIKPVEFPYQWDNVVGTLAWDGERLNVLALNGWHGDTYLDINGSDPEWPTFVQIPREGPVAWEIHFGDLQLVKVTLTEELERALPKELARTLYASDLQGTVDLQMRLDMRGWNNAARTVTANWKMLAVFRENSLFAGLPLRGVTGKVNVADGTWDGQTLRMEGYCDLEKAFVMNMPFTNVRSPFHLDGDRLILGTPKFLGAPIPFKRPNPYQEKQLRAELYSGQIGFDTLVLFGARPELTQYRSEINVNDVELAEWAADQFRNVQRLHGKVNGLLAIQGVGPSPKAIAGKGWVNIVPAAIMELPAFAQMFTLINFRPAGDSAFNYAYADFDIRDGYFDFSRIALRGEALGLIGKGTVGFAAGSQSPINLKFDSRTNNRLPFLRPIVERLGNNWIRIQVTGSVQEPTAVIQPRIGPLDDAFREFTETFEKGQIGRPPLRSNFNP